IKYNPDGGKEYVELVAKELVDNKAMLTDEWGLDHAAWGVLKYIYPNANIPTFEISINGLLNEEQHYEIGKKLSKFRDMGILIIASGNIVHNLREMNYDMYSEPFDWAIKFDNHIAEAIKNRDHKSLIDYK
ncbi:4,5-DOPA dioxygenase extradiol, partial [Clostridium perfringens]